MKQLTSESKNADSVHLRNVAYMSKCLGMLIFLVFKFRCEMLDLQRHQSGHQSSYFASQLFAVILDVHESKMTLIEFVNYINQMFFFSRCCASHRFNACDAQVLRIKRT